MAMTLPETGKALEDLTKAYNNNKARINDIEGRYEVKTAALDAAITAKTAAATPDDFIQDEKQVVGKEITPLSLKTIEQSISPANPFVIFTNGLKIFKQEKNYTVSAQFKAQTHTVPKTVSIQLFSKAAIIAESEKIPFTAGAAVTVTVNFSYPQGDDSELQLAFMAEKQAGGVTETVIVNNFKIEVHEKAFSAEQIQNAQTALALHTEKCEPFYNAIRNKNGSLVVPEPKQDSEVSNMKFVKDEIKRELAKLIDNAPEELNTLKELAEALKKNKNGVEAINTALSNRYTKMQADSRFVKKTVFHLEGTTLNISME